MAKKHKTLEIGAVYMDTVTGRQGTLREGSNGHYSLDDNYTVADIETLWHIGDGESTQTKKVQKYRKPPGNRIQKNQSPYNYETFE